MPVPEPTGPLWAAVKAIYDPWPLDLEESATALAAAWRQGGTAMATGAIDSTAAGTAANAAWDDNPGDGFTATVSTEAQTIGQLKAQMEVAAGRGDAYATQLTDAKTDIVTNISDNTALYTLLGNPLFGPFGPMLQQQLATWVAGNLQSMIEGRAEALRTGTATAVPKPEPLPPPPPSAPPKDDGNFWSDLGHLALDVVGLVPVVGEAADLINAGWYAAEGDYLNAGLSLAAAIPVAGWISTGGKLGYKAVTSLDGAKNWLKDTPTGVPWTAVQKPYSGPAHVSKGLNYQWKDPATGKSVRYHAHGPDSTARAGSNAADGPTYRERVGRQYVDASGRTHDANGNAYTEKFLKKNDDAADATHVPFDTRNFPEPHVNRIRVQPNVAAFVPVEQPTGGQNR